MTTFSEFIQKISSYSQEDIALIRQAHQFALEAHGDQKRFSGEPYINHPIAVASSLVDLGMDSHTIIAGLLHDTIEDTSITADQIEHHFGKDIRFLVDGVTKLSKIRYRGKADLRTAMNQAVLNLRRLFVAMAEDIRVIIIKLADRQHNMETLEHVPKHKRKRIALETLEIYAPIAERLGMGQVKGRLEDLAFPYVYPREYRWVTKHTRINYANRKSYLAKIIPIIRQHLKHHDLEPLDIHARVKHHYSLYKKIIQKDMDIDRIYDLVALRIVLPTTAACYEALGVIHTAYKPMPKLIKDYIALPRPNGYQSLHTTIFCEGGDIVEIQLRTPEMHEHAEHGIAAHWIYSEAGKKKIHTGQANWKQLAKSKEVEWIFKLRESLEKVKTNAVMDGIRTEFFKNRIFVMTPKGDIKELPDGSTPIDFAYAVHTGLGHHVGGARVDGRMVSIDYPLKNGEVVEIIKSKKPKPSQDWLRIVKTSLARREIRNYFSKK